PPRRPTDGRASWAGPAAAPRWFPATTVLVPMRALPRSRSRRMALLLAAGCLVAVSVVQASIRASANKPLHVHRRFDIHGRLTGPLAPGGWAPVSVQLNNRLRTTL